MRFSLRAKTVLMMLFVAMLPVVTTGAVSHAIVVKSSDLLDKGSEEEITLIARDQSQIIQGWVDKVVAGVQTTAQWSEITVLDRPAVEARLKAVAGAYPELQFIRVANAGGDDVAHSNDQAYLNFADRQWFQGAMKGNPITAQTLITKATGKPALAIATPLKGPDQKVMGVLEFAVGLDNVSALVSKLQVGKQGYAFLVDEQGQVLAHPDPKLFLEKVADLEPVARALQGKTGQMRYTDAVNVTWVTDYRPVGLGWGLVVQKPEAEVQAAGNTYARQNLTRLGEVGLGITLVCLLLALGLSRIMMVPIKRLSAAAERVAGGDLTLGTLSVRSQDELGDMARSFERMVANLRRLVQNVSAGAQQVAASSETLSAASEQSAEATDSAAQAVVGVAAGADEQAKVVHEVRQAVDELQQTITQIAAGACESANEIQKATVVLSQMAAALGHTAEAARGVAQGSQRAALTAQSGSRVVEETVAGIARAKDAVDHSAERIRDLATLSAQVSHITQVISDIADQTNLLALNAAIEAARAGEHGRGFSVVADEVRKLAQRSAKSAGEIAGLIGTIGERTAEAVQAMQLGTAEVDGGSSRAGEAGQALAEILTVVQQSAAEVESIAIAAGEVQQNAGSVVGTFHAVATVAEENSAATEEMAASAESVTQAVDRIAQVATNNARVAEQVSSAVSHLTASSTEVVESARSLSGLARDLQQQIAQFKV
ncbi:MAG TPA: methyl-accepting chemotaxis protein [Symbiobacteriaceae bacterium]|jgi:methyl-accepting chemotaxis protein